MRRSWITWVLLLVVSVIPLFDLLHPGLPVTHDGQDHVVRIANFYQSLSEGNIVPRWAANLNWGYGHPVIMFLYPLPSYIASFFHVIGFTFVDSTKLVFAVAFVASVITMYLWASSAWGVLPGLTSAILYGFAPYRFVDLYVRGAIGEHVAFIFPPIICFGLLRRSYALITIGTFLLILSHNALSLMFLPFIGLYALYLAATEKTKGRDAFSSLSAIAACPQGIATRCRRALRRWQAGWFIVLGFALSAFYWMPAFFEGKYTLRDIVTAGEFSGRFVPWLSFLYSPWSYGGGNELSKWLGGGQILALVMSFYAIERKTKYQKTIIVVLLLLFLTLFSMTQGASPLWNVITILQKFQFPWRLMSVVVFLIAIIGGIAVDILPDKIKKWMAALIIVITVFSTILMWRAKNYKQYDESFFTTIYNGTTDTGESSPIWSIRFMEKRPENLAYVVPKNGDITISPRTTTTREYHVSLDTTARFVESTLYFPGWQVYVNNSLLPIDRMLFQDPAYRGLMTFDLDPGTYDIRFVFTQTKLRALANLVSLVSFLVFFFSIGTIQLLWRKRK